MVVEEQESPYSPEELERWKAAILRKGQDIAERLTKLLAQKNATLATLHTRSREEEARREKRLREFLDRIQNVLASLPTAEFGRCESCSQHLSSAELTEMPWADHCRHCPGTDGLPG